MYYRLSDTFQQDLSAVGRPLADSASTRRQQRARYRGPDGHLRSKSFPTKIRAQRWLTDQLSSIDRATWVSPEYGAIRWASYSEQLLAGRVHLAPRTIETDRRCHKRAIEWIGDMPLNRLTPN